MTQQIIPLIDQCGQCCTKIFSFNMHILPLKAGNTDHWNLLSEAAAVRVTYCIKSCIIPGSLLACDCQRAFNYPWNQVHSYLSCILLCTTFSAFLLTVCDKNRSSNTECPNSFWSFQSPWASRSRIKNIEHLQPFLGELCGEVGGEDSCEDALETVSSDCFLWRSKLPSSDNERIFFKACGELMPLGKN